MGDSGELTIVDIISGEVTHRVDAHKGHAVGAAWDPSGSAVWTGGVDGALRLWKVADSIELIFERQIGEAPLYEVAVSHDGGLVAVGGEDSIITLFDARTGESRALLGHAGPVFGMTFDQTGRRLASVGYDGRLRLWDTQLGEEVLQLPGKGASFFAVAFSESGDRLAASAADGRVFVWSAARLAER